MKRLAIIIPCYNEEKRLKTSSILELVNSSYDVEVYLANDGSKDRTTEIIDDLCRSNKRVFSFHYSKNEGKAKTIFKSFKQLVEKEEHTHFGYLDADFSTESAEYIEMYKFLLSTKKQYIFGSRILTLNAEIDRKTYRHLIGRSIITFINFFFHLKIYDTQCGAKIFDKQTTQIILQKSFITNWLFDIEIFIRFSKLDILKNGIEYPLKRWQDVGGSKIKKTDIFKIFSDIIKLIKNYK